MQISKEKHIVHTALRDLYNTVGNLGEKHQEQQGANEFYLQEFPPMANDVNM